MNIHIENDLDPKTKEFLLNQEWYHQGFDGIPYLMWYIAIAEAREEPRKLICHADTRCAFFHNHRCDWYLMEKDNKITTDLFIEKSKEDSNLY